MITRRQIAALGLATPFIGRAAAAQDFTRPLRIVVPFAPGGTSDILARLLQAELGRNIGQNVVVENRPGAAGNLGADHVAKSTPDGTAMLLLDASSLATAPALYSRLSYNPLRDLAPITMLIYAPYVLVAHPSVPLRDAREAASVTRAAGGRFNFANSGVGGANHLTAIMLAQHWGADITQVPYRGGSAALTAVAANEAQLLVNGATATLPFVADGRLRAIAVSGEARLPSLPNVPTFRELGWPGQTSGTWQGVLATGGTPPAVVARLHRAYAEAMAKPEIAARVTELGGVAKVEGPEGFATWLATETVTWGGVVRAANIKLD